MTLFVNLLIVFLVSAIYLKKANISVWIKILILIELTTPYFLNGVLFSPDYMSDQIRYLEHVINLRENFFVYSPDFPVSKSSFSISFPAFLMSLIPVPFIEDYQSLGLANRFLFTMVMIFLIRKKILPTYVILFLIFYPSLLLYTSLALRESLIISIMLLSINFFYERKIIFCLAGLITLYVIKMQNFAILILFWISDKLYQIRNQFKFEDLMSLFLVSIIVFSLFIMPKLDDYRRYFYWHDGGDLTSYISINNFSNLLREFLYGIYFILVKPINSDFSKKFHLIQFIENIVLIFFLIYAYLQTYIKNHLIANKWLLFFVFSIGLYGLIVFNFGTASRYKFVFPIVFIVGPYLELNSLKRCK